MGFDRVVYYDRLRYSCHFDSDFGDIMCGPPRTQLEFGDARARLPRWIWWCHRGRHSPAEEVKCPDPNCIFPAVVQQRSWINKINAESNFYPLEPQGTKDFQFFHHKVATQKLREGSLTNSSPQRGRVVRPPSSSGEVTIFLEKHVVLREALRTINWRARAGVWQQIINTWPTIGTDDVAGSQLSWLVEVDLHSYS